VRSDFWLFIGAAASVVIVPFFILAMTRRPRLEAPLLTITFCFTFYLFSQRAHPGTMRYIVSALPFVYAFAAQEIVRFVLRPVAIAAVTLALLIPRIQQIDDVVHGRGEVYAGLPGGFDLRPALRTIESRGYTICWADYWIGYKLQWMSDERVRFIPYHSLDRTRAESAKLKAMPGRKCFVDARGNVTEMDPRDDGETAIGRTARERLRRMTGAPIIP
jgi:hypothetical protein